MRSSMSIFDKDVTFPHGGKIYTIEKKVPDQGCYNSLTPSQFDNYLISSDDEEQFILKMMQSKSVQRKFSFDNEDDQQIDQEYSVLQKINKHPHTLQCIGKVNIVDKFQNMHTSLIVKKLSSSLERYFETTIHKLNQQALINLSTSLILSFLSFERENILFNDELTLSYFGVDEEENIVITNGFSFCTIHEQEISEVEKESYIYKKNCAQIKSIVFAILTANKELLKKYITPYNLQSSVDKIIIQKESLLQIMKSYAKFENIFKDNNLISLKIFLSHLAKFKGQEPFRKQMSRQESMQKSQSKMERLQKVPSQIFKVTINSEINETCTPEEKATVYDISTITEDDEKDPQEDSQTFQIIDIKNQQKKQSKQLSNTNPHTSKQPQYQEEVQQKSGIMKAGSGTPKKLKNIGFVEIEMQAPVKDQMNNYIPPQEVSNVSDFAQHNQANQNIFQGRSSIQSQGSNMSETFRKKADKLKEEEIEDIKQQVKRKQKERGDHQRCKQDLENAKQIVKQMNAKQIIKKQMSDEENQYQSGNSDTPMADQQESARRKNESLSDKLLITKYENTSLISDANVIKIMIALLLVFIIGGIVFGAVFNFGVSKSNSDDPIECQDKNCDYCARYDDECTNCKSDYYLDSNTLKCVNKCSVSNCSVCISNYKTCETCSTGYVLYQNTCITKAESCPVSNCDSCTDKVCTTCSSGYRLYNKQCYKKCTDSVCLQCGSDTNVCTECEPNFIVDPISKKCVSA